MTFQVTKANDSTAITIKNRNRQTEAWITYGITREMIPSWVLSLVNKRIVRGLERKMKDDWLALERKTARMEAVNLCGGQEEGEMKERCQGPRPSVGNRSDN